MSNCFLDSATPKPGKFDLLSCGVCDEFMNVRRNVPKPVGYGKSSIQVDHFTCPNIDEDWHFQAKMIQEAARKTPSAIIERALLQEAMDIIDNRCFTKKVSRSIFRGGM